MNIRKLIPLLDEDDLNELAKKVAQAPDGVYEGISMKDLLPFMDEDELGKRMLDEAKAGRDISQYGPFVDEDAFDSVLDLLESGQIVKGLARSVQFMEDEQVGRLMRLTLKNGGSLDGIDARSILPFMDEDDVDRMFEDLETNGGEGLGLSLSDLLPFVSDEKIDEAFLFYARKGDPRAKKLAKYADDDAFHKLAQEFIGGKLANLNIEDYYPFMDEDDIKAIFRDYLHRH